MDVCIIIIINKMRLSVVTRNQKMCWKIVEPNSRRNIKDTPIMFDRNEQWEIFLCQWPTNWWIRITSIGQSANGMEIVCEWISRRNEIQQQSAWSMHALFIGSQQRVQATIDCENLGMRGVECFRHWIHYPLAEKPTMKLTKCLSHHGGYASCSSPFKKQQELISFWFNLIGIFVPEEIIWAD